MAQPPATQFSGIFISYRRDDSAAEARQLRTDLAHHFGKDRVFRDINDIEPGEDFVDVIERNLASCGVLVAIIGRYWLSTADGGVRRLDNPKDFVRLEIAAAISRGIRVIPVLVQGADVPKPEDLPDELAKLTRRQAHKLRDDSWEYDINKLVAALEGVLSQRVESGDASSLVARRLRIFLGAIVLAGILIGTYAYVSRIGRGRDGPFPNGQKGSVETPAPVAAPNHDSENAPPGRPSDEPRDRVVSTPVPRPTTQKSQPTTDERKRQEASLEALDRAERQQRSEKALKKGAPTPTP